MVELLLQNGREGKEKIFEQNSLKRKRGSLKHSKTFFSRLFLSFCWGKTFFSPLYLSFGKGKKHFLNFFAIFLTCFREPPERKKSKGKGGWMGNNNSKEEENHHVGVFFLCNASSLYGGSASF